MIARDGVISRTRPVSCHSEIPDSAKQSAERIRAELEIAKDKYPTAWYAYINPRDIERVIDAIL